MSRERFGDAWDLLLTVPAAHRGLWGQGMPENSLAAFSSACDAGYGIELDVQLSADGVPVVFHDAKLQRLCSVEGGLADHTAEQLGAMRLAGTEQTVPTLADTLALVAGRALIQVELKTPEGAEGPLEQAVTDVLDAYPGPFAVIGFNPASHAWFARERPAYLRGLDSYSYGNSPLPEPERARRAALQHVTEAQPHFLALGLDMLPDANAARLRAEGLPVVAWTCRTPAQWEAVKDSCDNLIFEGWRP